jgi:hypothetical protein
VIGDSQDPYGAVAFSAAPRASGCITAAWSRAAVEQGKALASVEEERLRGGAVWWKPVCSLLKSSES